MSTTHADPTAELDSQFSSDGATATPGRWRANDEPFRLVVRDGVFRNGECREALLYEVAPVKAFGFGKGKAFSQTRWRF